jgi:uncharacterized protein YdeI (YjbR/CyaY-like superfamily)
MRNLRTGRVCSRIWSVSAADSAALTLQMREPPTQDPTDPSPRHHAAMEPLFFASASEWRAWLAEHHATATEVVVGFHKKKTGKPSMTWSEAVDQALCFGWIDGIRHSLGPDAYTNRFTPRKPTSNWSNVNVAKVEALRRQGLMHPAGLAAFALRPPVRTGVYSFEAGDDGLGDYEAEFRRDAMAWSWFESQPPGYRKQASHWVRSAKREETRRSRLLTLIADSRAGKRIKPLRRAGP